MTRHIQNISFYFTKLRTIFWVFEIVIPYWDIKNDKQEKEIKLWKEIVGPVDENEKLEVIIA